MASNLRVDQITASTSDSVSIGTATFTGGLSGDITGLNVTGVITATTLNQNVTGVVTATGGFVVGTGASVYSPATNVLALGTNSAERVRINSTGVGIKTNDPDAPLTIQESGDVQIRLKNSSGLTKAFLGTTGAFGSGSTDDLRIRSEGNILFGSAGSEKMRMLSGGGITFNGDTATANALDDYEEGDWTPIASASSGTITSYTSSGRYTKIGRIVTLHFSISISNQGTAGGQYLLWSGAPFTASNTINQMGVGREMNVNGYLSSCFIQGNATNGGFYRWDNSGVIVNGTFQAMIVYNVG